MYEKVLMGVANISQAIIHHKSWGNFFGNIYSIILMAHSKYVCKILLFTQSFASISCHLHPLLKYVDLAALGIF